MREPDGSAVLRQWSLQCCSRSAVAGLVPVNTSAPAPSCQDVLLASRLSAALLSVTMVSTVSAHPALLQHIIQPVSGLGPPHPATGDSHGFCISPDPCSVHDRNCTVAPTTGCAAIDHPPAAVARLPVVVGPYACLVKMELPFLTSLAAAFAMFFAVLACTGVATRCMW